MALNLSTLTNASTSGTVLTEALTTADFLDSVPILKNLSRGSNKGGDAKQTTALNQPKALPLIKNPSGNLGGYLYIPDVSGNYATGPSVTIGANQTWEAEVDMVVTQISNYIKPLGGGGWTSGFGLAIRDNGGAYVWSKTIVGDASNLGITLGTPFNIKYGFDGTQLFVEKDGTRQNLIIPSSQVAVTEVLQLNQQTLDHSGNYAIQKAKLTVNSAVVFDCDFNGSTSIRHGDTKLQAAVGGPVTINQSGNDPATVIKKSVLRFDGVNDSLQGLFANNIDGGYMFAAFSVLGDGGGVYGRVLSVNNATTPALDYNTPGGIFSLHNNPSPTTDLSSFYNSAFLNHSNMFDPENGDILHEVKIQSGSNLSRVNKAGLINDNRVSSINSDVFNISQAGPGGGHVSLDLEYLALFPASLTTGQADSVRNYINNRNNVFSLIDSQGYYFFDPQIFPIVDPADFVSYWNGNIVGSDLTLNASVSQSVVNDRPTRDGYKITFNDNADHLVVASPLSGGQAGWQVVGTSLGTFAYRVNANAVTELNLLGNLGSASYRQAGDLYGVMLLPESATGADIEAARKLLIDRGAADTISVSSAFEFWRQRDDIREFKETEFSSVTNLGRAWRNCRGLSSFSPINAPNCNNFNQSWNNTEILTQFPAGAKLGTSANNVNFTSAFQSSGLTSFPALDLSTGSNFANSFTSSALTSFPAGIKMGTAATGDVQFTDTWRDTTLSSFPALDLGNGKFFNGAWRDCHGLTSFPSGINLGTNKTGLAFPDTWRGSGLTSFPALDLSTGAFFNSAWKDCSSLTSFPSGAKLGTSASNVNFTSAFKSSGLTSFPADIDLSKGINFANTWRQSGLTSFPAIQSTLNGRDFFAAWYFCQNLTSFGAANLNASQYFSSSWQSCANLEDFPALFTDWNPSSIVNGVFNNTWDGCTSLTANSVEAILTSIDASGQHGTDDGTSTGNPLGDSGIDIDYNVATGSLSAATNAAVTSLKAKGWSIIVNNVTL